MIGAGRHRHAGRDADKEQQRHDEKADAEHAGDQPDDAANPQQEEGVDGNLADGQVYFPGYP